jgi:hypothetical protein
MGHCFEYRQEVKDTSALIIPVEIGLGIITTEYYLA